MNNNEFYSRINMTLTNAEKQRRYRKRRNMYTVKRAKHLHKRKQKFIDNIQIGKHKRIIDITEREQRMKRRQWRKIKQGQRKKKTEENKVLSLTHPSSPVGDISREHHNTRRRRRRRAIAKC